MRWRNLTSDALRAFYVSGLALLCLGVLAACGASTQTDASVSASPALAEQLTLYNWEDDLPQSVLDAFTEEFNVEIIYEVYDSQEEVMDNIRAGEIYDVVVLDNDLVLAAQEENLLAAIDYGNVSNFKNIAANFRDLAYDPGNVHSVPYSWGTTALIVRSDLVEAPVTRWADLWDPRYSGKVGVRDAPRETVSVALKSLGYSINSEDPAELQAAAERLDLLAERAVFVDDLSDVSAAMLLAGEIVMLIGWAEDAIEAREQHPAITYVLPEEGAMLWGDNFVIPANSTRKYTAELFLDFLLRPDISAQIVNENYYASANEGARAFVDQDILNDAVIFPPAEDLRNAEIFFPLTSSGLAMYTDIFRRFQAHVAQVSR